MSAMDLSPLFDIILQKTNQTTFCQLFNRFCYINLPPNPTLRKDLISSIQQSSANAIALKPPSWYTRESLLPHLPEIWQKTTVYALASPGSIAEIANIEPSSLQRLRLGNFLHQEIVEAYLQLLRHKSATISSIGFLDAAPGTYQAIEYNEVRYRGQIFLPIYHRIRQHWSFVRLTPDREVEGGVLVELYDSIEQYIPPSFAIWYQRYFPNIPIRGVLGQSPKHSAESQDGGLYMLMGIRLLCLGSFPLEQHEADDLISPFRYRVLAEILAGKLNPSNVEHDEFLARNQGFRQVLEFKMREVESIDRDGDDEDSDEHPVDSGKEKETCDTVVKQIKSPDTRVKSSIHASICSFADEKSMVQVLRIAVRTCRHAQRDPMDYQNLELLYEKIRSDNQTQDILLNRHYRERFSRLFFQHMDEHSQTRARANKSFRKQMSHLISLDANHRPWKAVQSQASRSVIWTELLDFFQEYLECPSTALCATSRSTASMEGMTRKSRETFFSGLARRLQNPADLLLHNLRAASALVQALLYGRLPNFTLAIERNIDLNLMDIVAAVSLDEKLRLPNTVSITKNSSKIS